MAKRVQVLLYDDIDKDVAADETVSFSLDGVNYEIDLTAQHAAQLRDALAVYVANAERVGGRKSAGRSARSGKRSDLDSVRSWARDQGMTVKDRGRIPAEILAAYDKAHG